MVNEQTLIRKWAYALVGVYVVLFSLFLCCHFTDWNEAFNKRFDRDLMEALVYASEINADEYYINGWDMYVIFGFDMDTSYYYGRTDNFNEKEISYQDRFHYGLVDDVAISNEKDKKCIVYIQKQAEKDAFRKNEYCITEFGDWFVAIADD